MKTINLRFTRIFAIIVFFMVLLQSGNAQEGIYQNYLFDEFKNASITFINGGKMTTKMNYDILNKQMIFIDPNNLLKALSAQDIKRIQIIETEEHAFIPFDKGIVELLSKKPLFYVEYGSRIKPSKVNIGYGSTSSTTPSQNITDIYINGMQPQNLTLKAIPEADLIFTYYVMIGEKIKKFRTLQQFKKLFSDKRNQIDTYLSGNKSFDINNPGEVLSIYNHIMGITTNSKTP